MNLSGDFLSHLFNVPEPCRARSIERGNRRSGAACLLFPLLLLFYDLEPRELLTLLLLERRSDRLRKLLIVRNGDILQSVGPLLRLLNVGCQPISRRLHLGKPHSQIFDTGKCSSRLIQ